MEKSNAPQGQDSTTKDTNQSKNQGAGGEGVAASPKHTPTANKNKETKAQKESVMWSWLKKQITIALIVEILIFAVTIKIACIYSGQLDQMAESNKINRDSLETVQRAYIIGGVDFLRGAVGRTTLAPTSATQWRFTATWENAGNTPATPTTQHFAVDLLEDIGEAKFIGEEKEHPIAQIAPRTTIRGGVQNIQESSVLESQFSGNKSNKRLFAWGWTAYRDVLPKTEPHLTEFCFYLKNVAYPNGTVKIGKSGVLEFPDLAPTLGWEYCRAHNCVDKQCEDYAQVVALLPR